MLVQRKNYCLNCPSIATPKGFLKTKTRNLSVWTEQVHGAEGHAAAGISICQLFLNSHNLISRVQHLTSHWSRFCAATKKHPAIQKSFHAKLSEQCKKMHKFSLGLVFFFLLQYSNSFKSNMPPLKATKGNKVSLMQHFCL